MEVTGSSIQQMDRGKDGKLPKSRCRKWRLWASTEQGRESRRVSGTYTQAKEELDAWVAELEAKVPNAETFAAYAESWRAWREKSGDLSPNTVAKDKRNVRALCRTGLAEMRMDEITPEDCRGALMWLKGNPVSRAGELSNSSIDGIHTALSLIMKQAYWDGRIARNPMERIKRPKVAPPERQALSIEEVALFLNRVDGLPLDGRSMALYLIACLGLRRAEACALLDDDVSGGFAIVRQSVKEADGSIGTPKSEAGSRVIPVPPRLESKLEEWRKERARLGYADAPTLACNTEGGVLRPQNLYKWWRKVAPSLGCEDMVLHELRHTNLSMIARHMSPFDLKDYAGWASIEPAKIYIHRDLDAVSRGVAQAWAAIPG